MKLISQKYCFRIFPEESTTINKVVKLKSNNTDELTFIYE